MLPGTVLQAQEAPQDPLICAGARQRMPRRFVNCVTYFIDPFTNRHATHWTGATTTVKINGMVALPGTGVPRPRRVDGSKSKASPGMTTTASPVMLLKAKATPPAPIDGYFHRPALERRIEQMLVQRRLAVLRAPGGFGKTALLADVVRRQRERGVLAAWMTVDVDDEPDRLAAYLAYAFECAGLELPAPPDAAAWRAAPQAVALLAHAIEGHPAPCLLVLDDMERLPHEAVPFLELLLRAAPASLRVGLAMRANPGLDLSAAILAGQAELVRADDLRFTRYEVAQFFGGELSRGDLATVLERTGGWPVALRICRTMRSVEPGLIITGDEPITANFVGVRLLRDLTEQDLAVLLDLAVFDDLDTGVDEVLGSDEARRRLNALTVLDGLVLTVEQHGAERRVLHPLIKNYCAEQALLRNPDRKRELHAALARVMARRGELMSALRHANEARDGRLLGQILDREGAFRVWQREGPMRSVRGRPVPGARCAGCVSPVGAPALRGARAGGQIRGGAGPVPSGRWPHRRIRARPRRR